MRKITVQICKIALIFIIIFSGCEQTSPTNSILPSIQVSPTIVQTTRSPEPSYIVTDEHWRLLEYAEEVDLGDNTYFLDTPRIMTNGKEIGCMVYCRNNTTWIATPLNILAYSIKAYGEHVYALVCSGEDPSFPYIGINTLYRIDNDGGLTPICSGDDYHDVDDALYEFDNSLYFTTYNENAIFKADLNCEDIERIPITLPEERDPLEYSKLTMRSELFVIPDIVEVKDGYMSFTYKISSENNVTPFYGSYKMLLSDNHVEKIGSRYYDSRRIVGSWLYYINLEDETAFSASGEALYDVHRMKQDGSGDENLGVECFRFDIAGEYLYADTDLEYGDFTHWTTYRYNLDGTGRKPLDYDDMVRYAEGDRLYFTQFDEDIIYVADTACNELMQIKITVPDENTLSAQIGGDLEYRFIKVIDQEDEWLSFEYRIYDSSASIFYFGIYRVNLQSNKIEKVNDGKFFT